MVDRILSSLRKPGSEFQAGRSEIQAGRAKIKARHDQIQIRRNEIKVGRNKNQFRRNEIQIVFCAVIEIFQRVNAGTTACGSPTPARWPRSDRIERVLFFEKLFLIKSDFPEYAQLTGQAGDDRLRNRLRKGRAANARVYSHCRG